MVLASYTLGSAGTCTDTAITGRAVADTALTSANTATIRVDVSVAGPFAITTNTVNGIRFSQTGTFDNTGTQMVSLVGIGTPIDTGTVSFTVTPLSGAGGSCTFSVHVFQGTPPVYIVTTFFNGVYQNFSDSAAATNSDLPGPSGATGLSISGRDTVSPRNSKVEFGVTNAGSVSAGIYSDTSIAQAYFQFTDSLGETWSVRNTAEPSFNIILTTVNTRNIEGSFNGTIWNQQGAGADSIVLTNGLFIVPLK